MLALLSIYRYRFDREILWSSHASGIHHSENIIFIVNDQIYPHVILPTPTQKTLKIPNRGWDQAILGNRQDLIPFLQTLQGSLDFRRPRQL